MRVTWPLIILRVKVYQLTMCFIATVMVAPWLGRCLQSVCLPFPHSQLAHFSASVDVIVPENGEPVGTREIKCCMRQIQELIISRLNQAVANKLISSVDYLRESFVGTLERCLQSLEKSQDISVHITSNNLKQVLKECLRHHVTDNAWNRIHTQAQLQVSHQFPFQHFADPVRILLCFPVIWPLPAGVGGWGCLWTVQLQLRQWVRRRWRKGAQIVTT